MQELRVHKMTQEGRSWLLTLLVLQVCGRLWHIWPADLPGGLVHPAALGTWLYLLLLCWVSVLLHLVGPTKGGKQKVVQAPGYPAQNPPGLAPACVQSGLTLWLGFPSTNVLWRCTAADAVLRQTHRRSTSRSGRQCSRRALLSDTHRRWDTDWKSKFQHKTVV